jgi:hypothetical protein
MESGFGHNFADVRILADARAAKSANAVNSRAYTVGRDIVFGPNQYSPDSDWGRQLVAHELAHTVQSERHRPIGLTVSKADHPCERDADRAAKAVMRGDRGDVISHTSQPMLCRLPPDYDPGYGRYLMEQPFEQKEKAAAGSPSTVYMCSKSLETSPLGSHAFFRIGGNGKGNTTISLQPIDQGDGCWQGIPGKNYKSDVNAQADCDKTPISLSCLNTEFAAYPIGHYCTWGPNSNTFVGHVAKKCGVSDPDPSGWTPGIDSSPPKTGTYAPDKWVTLRGCRQIKCTVGSDGKTRKVKSEQKCTPGPIAPGEYLNEDCTVRIKALP